MQPFRNLQAWQKAHELTLSVYKLTEQFPSHEIYGLTSQLRRAAYSILSFRPRTTEPQSRPKISMTRALAS